MSPKRMTHICGCGCGGDVPSRLDPLTGMNKGQGHRSKDGNYYIPSHGRKIAGRFAAERMKADGNPNWKPVGSTFVDRGYVYEKIADGVWPRQHRLIAGVSDPTIHVHHDNEDTMDNSPENLIPLTASEHKKLHIERTAWRWSVKFLACTACSTTERKHAGGGLCHRCYQRKLKGCPAQIGHWSLDHERCADCGTTDRKHRGRGLCERCYSRIWQREAAASHRLTT